MNRTPKKHTTLAIDLPTSYESVELKSLIIERHR